MTLAARKSSGRLVLMILGAWMALAAIGAGGVWASSTLTYRDNFDSVSYSGNDGTTPWSGSWLESGESDGPATGRVRVVTRSECVAGSCGRLSAGSNTTAGIHRRADLSGASAATLTFSYRRTKSGGAAGIARVSVSSDGGGSWSTLATYTLDVTDDNQSVQSFGITPYLTTQTQVRFRVESTPGQSGTFYFDNVQISASFPDPTTTTSTSTTSTTTTSSPPSTTSTTTSSPPSSTATGPPSSTTTTLASTTTTAPPSSTTTTLPPVPTTTIVDDISTTTTLLTAPPRAATGRFTTPFPIQASEPVGDGAVAIEFAGMNSTDPDVSGLVTVAMSEFAQDPPPPPLPVVDVLQAAATGATEGAGATIPTLVPLGLAGIGLVIGWITRRRHWSRPSPRNGGRR